MQPKISIFSLTVFLIASQPGASNFLGSKPFPTRSLPSSIYFLVASWKASWHSVLTLILATPREIAAAIIQIKKGYECTESDIEEFCAALPRYKRPRKIIFADVPRNPTGKIEKPKLRRIYGADMLVSQQNNS